MTTAINLLNEIKIPLKLCPYGARPTAISASMSQLDPRC